MKDKIFNKFKYYILLIANKKYPQIRKRKYDLTYYLTNFVHTKRQNEGIKQCGIKDKIISNLKK